jgi:cytochrome c-type biogenesis protein CcmH
MVFWLLAIAVTAVACAALYYASARRAVNAVPTASEGDTTHFRLALAEIEADRASGKLGEAEAAAARKELARELVRRDRDGGETSAGLGRGPVLAGVTVLALASLGLYGVLGRPDLPGQPLAERPEILAQQMDVGDAIARIEARLAQAPDDARGWAVIAPAYMEMQRFGDAANAFRQVIDLEGPTAGRLTDLAEALILENGGDASGEPLELLQEAAASDPADQRSRYYIAGELTRQEQFAAAADAWRELIALSDGSEGWLATAQQGLAFAEAEGIVADPETVAADEQTAIQGMVETLSARLEAEGGSVEEWTRLVRSYIVLDDLAQAQRAYDAAVAIFPRAFDRGDLDTIALAAGLTLNGDEQ